LSCRQPALSSSDRRRSTVCPSLDHAAKIILLDSPNTPSIGHRHLAHHDSVPQDFGLHSTFCRRVRSTSGEHRRICPSRSAQILSHFQSITPSPSASGFGTDTGIPVTTQHSFYDTGAAADTICVQRTFQFGATPFTDDVRPYFARLYPESKQRCNLRIGTLATAPMAHLPQGVNLQSPPWLRAKRPRTNWRGHWHRLYWAPPLPVHPKHPKRSRSSWKS
jgi:hypothetical protein